jgi:hypothetical protein
MSTRTRRTLVVAASIGLGVGLPLYVACMAADSKADKTTVLQYDRVVKISIGPGNRIELTPEIALVAPGQKLRWEGAALPEGDSLEIDFHVGGMTKGPFPPAPNGIRGRFIHERGPIAIESQASDQTGGAWEYDVILRRHGMDIGARDPMVIIRGGGDGN